MPLIGDSCERSLIGDRARSMVETALRAYNTRVDLVACIYRYKGKKFLVATLEKLILGRMLRKKYVYRRASEEKTFLVALYRSFEDKRGRQIANRLEDVDDHALVHYCDKFIHSKSLEYIMFRSQYHVC